MDVHYSLLYLEPAQLIIITFIYIFIHGFEHLKLVVLCSNKYLAHHRAVGLFISGSQPMQHITQMQHLINHITWVTTETIIANNIADNRSGADNHDNAH